MDWAETVRATRAAETHRSFEERVDAQARSLREALAAGAFEGAFRIGLELEGYVVDEDGSLSVAPEAAIPEGYERELGRHTGELHTPVSPFDAEGLASQATSLTDRVSAVKAACNAQGRTYVMDGMWTISPPEGTVAYLSAMETREGLEVPRNVAPEARYYALDADITADGPVRVSLPGCDRTFPNILVESLASSMQIHLQTPTEQFAAAFNAAIRTAGPVVALAANSPFLPPDLYTDADVDTMRTAGVELRIPVFETMNVEEPGKVRFPRDIDSPMDAVDRIVDDRLCAPYLREWHTDEPRDGFADDYWEFIHKQGTCWRWIRPIFGPDGPRIEYRPLAAQPSTGDVLSFQALVAGLLNGIVATDHPVQDLDWDAARDSFYAAAHDGLDADLAWITRDGDRTTDPASVYPDLFATARAGLDERDVPAETIDELLAPVEQRWTARTTPATWKIDHVTAGIAAGEAPAAAITDMQRTYIEQSKPDTLFTDW